LPRGKKTKSGFSETNHVAATQYGFTDEKLDFIPSTQLRAGNYAINYRMGRLCSELTDRGHKVKLKATGHLVYPYHYDGT